MTRKVAILQSNYLPWKGYFDIIASVDRFIFYDDVQYTKNDWRNRNRIKTPKGTEWITVPCGSGENRLICEVQLENPAWQRKHWKMIVQNYRRAACFRRYSDFLEDIFRNREWRNLSDMNQYLIRTIAREFLGIPTEFDDSRRYRLERRKGARVLELLEKTAAGAYLSGPAGRDYLEVRDFEKRGIALEWMDYSGYPEYRQLYPPFRHDVSIIDLLLNEGPDAASFLKRAGTAQAGSRM